MTSPRVTIGIPAYRAEPFIERCVRSALVAAGDVAEVIVLDDASPDGTAERVAAIRDPRLSLVRHPANIGRVENVKAALEVGTGDLVTLLPADCALPPDSVTRRAAALTNHPGSTFAFGAVELCDAADATMGYRTFVDAESVLSLQSPGPLLPSNRVFLSACMIRRSAYQAVGGLHIDVAPTHRDWDLLLRLAASGPAVAVPEMVAIERVHAGNVTEELARDDRIVTAELLVLDAFRRWVAEHAPGVRGVVADATHEWSRRRLAHALLAIAGYTSADPARALGCALTLSPEFRRSPRYYAALVASALPRGAMRPLLHALLGPSDRRRRHRDDRVQTPSS